jgi:hypothetical protein
VGVSPLFCWGADCFFAIECRLQQENLKRRSASNADYS